MQDSPGTSLREHGLVELDQWIEYPPLRRAIYCFSWTRKPHESDSVQFQCIPVFHTGVAGTTARLAADEAAMDGAFRCRPLQVVASLPSAERTSRATICSKRFHPLRKPAYRNVGACSWLCERTQPVRCRSLNAAARSQPHLRHRQHDKGATRSHNVHHIRFITADVAFVDIDNEVRGVKKTPGGIFVPPNGVLRTKPVEVYGLMHTTTLI